MGLTLRPWSFLRFTHSEAHTQTHMENLGPTFELKDPRRTLGLIHSCSHQFTLRFTLGHARFSLPSWDHLGTQTYKGTPALTLRLTRGNVAHIQKAVKTRGSHSDEHYLMPILTCLGILGFTDSYFRPGAYSHMHTGTCIHSQTYTCILEFTLRLTSLSITLNLLPSWGLCSDPH